MFFQRPSKNEFFTPTKPPVFRNLQFHSTPVHINNAKYRDNFSEPLEVGSRMPGDDRGSPSSMSEFDSALGTSTASPGSGRKAHR